MLCGVVVGVLVASSAPVSVLTHSRPRLPLFELHDKKSGRAFFPISSHSHTRAHAHTNAQNANMRGTRNPFAFRFALCARVVFYASRRLSRQTQPLKVICVGYVCACASSAQTKVCGWGDVRESRSYAVLSRLI